MTFLLCVTVIFGLFQDELLVVGLADMSNLAKCL